MWNLFNNPSLWPRVAFPHFFFKKVEISIPVEVFTLCSYVKYFLQIYLVGEKTKQKQKHALTLNIACSFQHNSSSWKVILHQSYKTYEFLLPLQTTLLFFPQKNLYHWCSTFNYCKPYRETASQIESTIRIGHELACVWLLNVIIDRLWKHNLSIAILSIQAAYLYLLSLDRDSTIKATLLYSLILTL